ncbi:MAG TPA: pilus assembly protein PilY [Gammaproteobacteria bacterium]|nr:pilus assembly protein PilY [Gammaproteobacteria bacterium]
MMQPIRNYFLVATFSFLGLCLNTPVATATQVNLSDAPLYVSLVKSNLIMAVDDSISMDFEVLFSTNNGALWWNKNDHSFTGRDQNDNRVGGGVINFNKSGSLGNDWERAVYLFPNGTRQGNRVKGDDDDHVAIPPFPQYAWTRSPRYNKAYFDPSVTYKPWMNYGGQTFGKIDKTEAPSDPIRGNYKFDLTEKIKNDDEDFTFRLYEEMVIPKGTVYSEKEDNDWKTADQDITIEKDSADYGIEYFPATFYLPAQRPLPAGFGYTGPVVKDGYTPKGEKNLKRYEIKPKNFADSDAYEAAIQNFANWFSYYRKRHLAMRAGIGRSFADISDLRVGSVTINEAEKGNKNITMWDLSNTVDRNTFYETFYKYGSEGVTPNKQALNYIGKQFERTDANAPITESCQQNFGTLFTDGYAAKWSGAGVGNADGDKGAPYADTASNTIADISMSYYTKNLRPDLAEGEVPVPPACNGLNPDPRLDCNSNPHMVTFGIVLAQRGNVFEVDTAATADPYTNRPAWPGTNDFTTRGPSSVDDLWHATVNSRGAMLNAKTPLAINSAFKAVLNNIAGRKSSAAAVALSTGSISASTRIYQAQFNSATWAGKLLSFPINSDGSIGAELWNAGDLIPSAANRNIITYDGSSGVDFLWSNLNTTQQKALNTNITDITDALGEDRLAYLRGNDSNEISKGGVFRNRPVSVLGDIVNSAPIYVGVPAFRYPDTLESTAYSSFQSSNTNRTPMVYTGANDGMLHGFDAVTGVEKLAYVPSMVYNNLSRLTSPQYSHTYYVDGTPTVGDAFINGSWKTVLVGGLNAGGQGIYALDVTNPDNFDDSSVLWEFTDADLGYTFSRPNIVRMANGVWAAVFGSGYNNTKADGNASSTGDAVLFIVNLETGELIDKIISTEVGSDEDPTGQNRPNALATVTPIDSNGDINIDAIYAGDLFGNVWKFDVSSSNPGNWQIAFGATNAPEPLFTACASTTTPCPANDVQPITSRMDVGRGPQGSGIMVYFGTGKYVESADTGDQSLQTFYGIRDSGNTIADRDALLRQTIIYEGAATTLDGTIPPFEVRVTSDDKLTSESGWYLDLIPPSGLKEGERVVSDPILNAGRIIFTTLIPDTAACSPGGQGWLMELDALSGSRLAYTPFDLTNDGDFTNADLITLSDNTVVAISGKKGKEIPNTPGILNDGDREFKYISGSSGGIDTIAESTSGPSTGRQSWQQLK